MTRMRARSKSCTFLLLLFLTVTKVSMVGKSNLFFIDIGWEYISKEESKIGVLFTKAINLLLEKQIKEEELETYISFFKYAFLV